MDFKNLDISEFIRYILTGFNFVVLVILLPALYLAPDLTKNVLADASAIIIILISIAIGYFMDILKVYQMTPKFNTKKNLFMDGVAKTLEIPREQASAHFSLASKLCMKYGIYDIDKRRSEWVLMLETGVALVVSSVIWSLIFVLELFNLPISFRSAIPISAIFFSLIFALRLFKIADHERDKGNQGFFMVLEKNKARIRNGWKLDSNLRGRPVKHQSESQRDSQR